MRKALSVKQPFASLIANGKKIYEIRSWKSTYRGPLIICSSKKMHESGSSETLYPTGVILCEVELHDIVKFTKDMCPWAGIGWLPDLWAWHIELIRILPQTPIKGQLGIFDIEYKT